MQSPEKAVCGGDREEEKMLISLYAIIPAPKHYAKTKQYENASTKAKGEDSVYLYGLKLYFLNIYLHYILRKI